MSIVYDFKAIKAATLAFPQDRPQNVIDPPKEPEPPAYSYSSGDLGDQPDYGMFAGFEPSVVWYKPVLEYAGYEVNSDGTIGIPTELIGFGRISIDSSDEGYAAYQAMIANHGHPKIFLDGVEVKDAVTVEPGKNGWVYRYLTDADGRRLMCAGSAFAMETVHGCVQVFKGD
jgi:hypothetical protein